MHVHMITRHYWLEEPPVLNACTANSKCPEIKRCDYARLAATVNYSSQKETLNVLGKC